MAVLDGHDRHLVLPSYLTVALATAMLVIAGGMGVFVGAGFVGVLALASRLENTKQQLSERVGTCLVFSLLIVFLLWWKYAAGLDLPASLRTSEFGALALFLLLVTTVKALQVKVSRDWLFIYLLSFFQVLLATSVGFSLPQSVMLLAYLTLLLTSVMFFVNRPTHSSGNPSAAYKSHAVERAPFAGRLTKTAVCLVPLVFVLAVPIFLLVPRLERGGRAHAAAGVTGFVGFSGHMRLGQIGSLQRSDEIVMRVRLDERDDVPADLRWRGTAFDSFDGQEWRRTDESFVQATPKRPDLFDLGGARGTSRLLGQTVFLEPIDTPVLFAVPRVVAVEGTFPYVLIDSEGGVATRSHPSERVSYRAYSDVAKPTAETLRADNRKYPQEISRYLEPPPLLDSGVVELAKKVIADASARTRYDAARAIESYLRDNYTYTLDMRARDPDPLADFLLRVRAGHCEYFASAMAVMLRSQDIAARVVNGFQSGRYNRTADAYVVRQADAHAWVEVYFPASDTWVAFDPTPFAGRPGSATDDSASALGEYAEALEMFWLQYVASYGRQEQLSLVAKIRGALGVGRNYFAHAFVSARDVWDDLAARVAGNDFAGGGRSTGAATPTLLAVVTLLSLLGFLIYRSIRKRRNPTRGKRSPGEAQSAMIEVDFYRRMTELLARHERRRASHETPSEFAASVRMPEVTSLTDAYHRVRYGGETLSSDDEAAIRNQLGRLAHVAVPGGDRK